MISKESREANNRWGVNASEYIYQKNTCQDASFFEYLNSKLHGIHVKIEHVKVFNIVRSVDVAYH